jgi:predicted dehydrogenase
MTKPKLRIGLIGSGFMGEAHAFGYANAARVFDLPFELEMHTLADISDESAVKAAAALGFARSTSDWRSLVADPEIDVVNITAPNALHKAMALATIAAGKHVYCEKPLAPLAVDAREMAEAAEAKGVKTQVGFNYLCNPVLGLARDDRSRRARRDPRLSRRPRGGLHGGRERTLHLPPRPGRRRCARRHRQATRSRPPSSSWGRRRAGSPRSWATASR